MRDSPRNWLLSGAAGDNGMNGKLWISGLMLAAFVGCSDTNPDPVETARPGSNSQAEQLGAGDVMAQLPEQTEPLMSADGTDLPVTTVSQPVEVMPTTDAFTKLCNAYTSTNGEAWAAAEKELLALGRETEPTLVSALSAGATHERELAAMMLAQIGADSNEARKALKAALKDESTFVQSNAVSALCACGDQSEELMTAVAALLKQDEADGRVMGAMSAANLGGAASELLPAIVALLTDETTEVRQAAAEAIGAIGTSDANTIQRLRAVASSDTNESVRSAADAAVAQIGGQPASDSDVVPAGATSQSNDSGQ